MAMERPSSRRMKSSEASLYSGLRMRAMVWVRPPLIRPARKHASMLSSSEEVTAMKRSVSRIPASSRVSQSAAFPQTPMTS